MRASPHIIMHAQQSRAPACVGVCGRPVRAHICVDLYAAAGPPHPPAHATAPATSPTTAQPSTDDPTSSPDYEDSSDEYFSVHSEDAESPFECGESGAEEASEESGEESRDEVWDTDPRAYAPSAGPPLKAENATGRWVLLPVAFWPACAKPGLVGWRAIIKGKASRGRKYICQLQQEGSQYVELDLLKKCKMLS